MGRRTTIQPARLVVLLAKVAAFVSLLYVANLAGEWLTSQFIPHLTPSTEPAVHRMIMVAVVVYAICMMLPFVPGMEIGLALMVIFGAPIVPLVYGVTVIALVLSFLAGRLIPQRTSISGLSALRLTRPARLLEEIQSLDVRDRLPWLLQAAPGRALPWLLRFRYLALMLLFNLPGNALLGGGGGIAMMSGVSRLFTVPGFFIAVALAVSPVPLLIFLTGAVPSSLTE